MRILFLGAGASIAAGYPPASRLLEKIEAEAKQSPNLARLGRWEQFDDYRRKATGILREVLHSSNPEVAISQLDLLLQTREARESEWWRRLKQASENENEKMEAFRGEPHPFDDEPAELSEVRQAIQSLEECLDDYFSWKHYQDSSKERSAREYLRFPAGLPERGPAGDPSRRMRAPLSVAAPYAAWTGQLPERSAHGLFVQLMAGGFSFVMVLSPITLTNGGKAASLGSWTVSTLPASARASRRSSDC